MKCYFISGMAADGRVFKYIHLPEGYEMLHLSWIPPLKGERLASYANRMAERIDASEPFVLIGLSMGGMIAAEICRIKKPVQTILISSIPSGKGLPPYFKWAGKWNLPSIIPVPLVKAAAKGKRLFTKERSADKMMLKQIIEESDDQFIKWAMTAISRWETQNPPENYIHIHGDRDPVLPIRFTHPTHIVKGAGHLLVMTHGRQVNKILTEILP